MHSNVSLRCDLCFPTIVKAIRRVVALDKWLQVKRCEDVYALDNPEGPRRFTSSGHHQFLPLRFCSLLFNGSNSDFNSHGDGLSVDGYEISKALF